VFGGFYSTPLRVAFAVRPVVQTFADSRHADRHSGGFQFVGDLLAVPALAVQGQQSFAQRFKQINGALAAFGRLVLCELFQFFIQRRVVGFGGDLFVVNAFAHSFFVGLISV